MALNSRQWRMEKMVINDFDEDIASSSKRATAAGLVIFRLETYVLLLTLPPPHPLVNKPRYSLLSTVCRLDYQPFSGRNMIGLERAT